MLKMKLTKTLIVIVITKHEKLKCRTNFVFLFQLDLAAFANTQIIDILTNIRST